LPRVLGDRLTLAYREWNADAPGLPLVLLHGVTGSSDDWRSVARELPGRRLLAFDARGHGESDWDPDGGYAGDDHFADAVTALDALGIERCCIAGFSMGGGIATMLAAALPERIAGAAVIDTYPGPEMTPGSLRIAGWISGYADQGAWFDPAIARNFRDQLAAGRAARLDLWPLWEALACPVMVVRGARSDVLPEAVAAEMLRRQRQARLVTIEGVAHPIPFARPRELAAALTELMESGCEGLSRA
jgi:pimeloyl-ACP methyl ester carboxylesterase